MFNEAFHSLCLLAMRTLHGAEGCYMNLYYIPFQHSEVATSSPANNICPYLPERAKFELPCCGLSLYQHLTAVTHTSSWPLSLSWWLWLLSVPTRTQVTGLKVSKATDCHWKAMDWSWKEQVASKVTQLVPMADMEAKRNMTWTIT